MKSTTLKLFVLAVLFISPACLKSSKSAKPPDVDYYTCTMHPSVHAEAPGKCPICGMDLVPVMKKNSDATSPAQTSPSGGTASGHEFVVPVERQQQIGVTYATVTRAPLHHTIRAVGAVETDLQRHWAFVARVDGYVKELFV
ncbi:MAG TPA: heavy metal-binding domain-containing protein, partial [Chthoniobacterales bacterium]|nr:heavy metal-binding domain-containing protein [Chthoniobacterales bacterium]